MNRVRACWRLLRLTVHVLAGWRLLRQGFDQLSAEQRAAVVQAWSRRALVHMGVALQVQGDPPAQGPLLVLANHVSWLDIVVMNAARPCRFVSKADVRHWPVLGRLAQGTGALFIEREKRSDAMRVVHHMAEQLRAGEVLAVFPEGTTGDGTQLLPFHANLLQAAVVTDAPVLPVALRYTDAATGLRCDAPVYIGNTTLLASLWRTLRQRGLQAWVRYGEPDAPQGRDRRTWAQGVRSEIDRLLAL